MRIRASGWRCAKPAKTWLIGPPSALDIPQACPAAAKSAAGTAFGSLGMVMAVKDTQCSAIGAKKPCTSLVLIMPQMICVSRRAKLARVAAIARPAAGLWPPSSQISLLERFSTNGPLRSLCMRAGQWAWLTAAVQAISPIPRWRRVAMAAPAFST